MLSERDGKLVYERYGREVVVARLTDADRYRALLAWGCKESVAAAVSRGLITIKLVA